MITRTEADKNGVPVRVYHRAGTWVTPDGDRRRDEKFIWTHPVEEQESCDACLRGAIPDEIRRSPR